MELSKIFKALSDNTRLEIVQMLSEKKTLCACKILEKFDITQPTLSHHMKSLCDCGLVNTEKVGKWSHYSLNQNTIKDIKAFINTLEQE